MRFNGNLKLPRRLNHVSVFIKIKIKRLCTINYDDQNRHSRKTTRDTKTSAVIVMHFSRNFRSKTSNRA